MSGSTAELELAGGVVLLTRHWASSQPDATIVTVHGAAEHSGRWGHVGQFLADSGFDTHAYDMRGHGRSGGHPMYVDSFDDYLGDLEAILERARQPGRPLIVYAHSLGGLVGAAYGTSSRPQPDLFVLSAPALGSTTPRVLRALAFILGGVLPRLTAPTAIANEQLSKDPSVGDAYQRDGLVHGRGSLRLGREVFKAMADTKRRLNRLTTPTLVIHGADDQLVPATISMPLGDLPNVNRKVFADLRHEMHNEPESEMVLAYVVAWIRGQLAAAA